MVTTPPVAARGRARRAAATQSTKEHTAHASRTDGAESGRVNRKCPCKQNQKLLPRPVQETERRTAVADDQNAADILKT